MLSSFGLFGVLCSGAAVLVRLDVLVGGAVLVRAAELVRRRPADVEAGGAAEHEAALSGTPVGHHAERGQGLVGTGVVLADAVDLLGLRAVRDVAAEGVGDADHLLDLLHGAHALALAGPQVVLVAHADVDAEGDADGVHGGDGAHRGLDGEDGAVGDTADELDQVGRVPSGEPAADGHVVEDQRAGVHAAADETLDGLQLGQGGELEVRLDAVRVQPLEVFEVEVGACLDDHVPVRRVVVGLGDGRPGEVVVGHDLDDVHLAGVDGDRHLVGPRVEFGQQVAGVVAEPLRLGALVLGGERDGSADLQDHVRDGLAQPPDEFVELGHALGAVPVQFTHVDVQDGGTGVVAVHGGLDVLVHGEGEVVGVAGEPLGAVGSDLDHQLLLVLGQQGVIEEVHRHLLVRGRAGGGRPWWAHRPDSWLAQGP